MHVDLDLSDYIAENEEDQLNIKIPYIVTDRRIFKTDFSYL
jgi:hypothetical protein